jgi:hypothetical protein
MWLYVNKTNNPTIKIPIIIQITQITLFELILGKTLIGKYDLLHSENITPMHICGECSKHNTESRCCGQQTIGQEPAHCQQVIDKSYETLESH